MWWAFLVVALIGYLLGSLPMGLIAGKVVRGVDIRDYGSGKTGFTNALRTIGLKAALLVLLGDALKGAVPVLIARLLSDDAYAQMVAGLAAVVGHDWPVFAGFRGGRGVTTFFGVLLAMNPLVFLAMVPVGVGIAVAALRTPRSGSPGGAGVPDGTASRVGVPRPARSGFGLGTPLAVGVGLPVGVVGAAGVPPTARSGFVRSWTKTSDAPLVSPGTRLLA